LQYNNLVRDTSFMSSARAKCSEKQLLNNLVFLHGSYRKLSAQDDACHSMESWWLRSKAKKSEGDVF